MYTMRPATFEYHRPESLDEALDLLAGDDAHALAGGHSLLPMMKLRLAAPETIVDLGAIDGLDGITREGDTLVIGALARHADVAASDVVQSACPVLAETAGLIGDRQVRRRGTIGGSLAHCDPGADYPTVTKALGATVVARGKGGERTISCEEFFTGLFTTALDPGELATAVRVPATPSGTGASYRKHRHPASGYAVVGAAAVVSVEGGSCSAARIVIGGVSQTPVAAEAAAGEIAGRKPDEAAIEAAAGKVAEAIGDPLGDVYASGEYRVHLAGVLAKRALVQALERAV